MDRSLPCGLSVMCYSSSAALCVCESCHVSVKLSKAARGISSKQGKKKGKRCLPNTVLLSVVITVYCLTSGMHIFPSVINQQWGLVLYHGNGFSHQSEVSNFTQMLHLFWSPSVSLCSRWVPLCGHFQSLCTRFASLVVLHIFVVILSIIAIVLSLFVVILSLSVAGFHLCSLLFCAHLYSF